MSDDTPAPAAPVARRPPIGTVRIALLDSGVPRRHRCWAAVTPLGARSFTGADPYVDRLGHGDLMADVLCESLRGCACPLALAVGQVIDTGTVSGGERLAEAMHWAVALGVSVIAVPLGTVGCHARLREATEHALTRSVRIVAAAGNPCRGRDRALYPAAIEGVVSVGHETFRDFYASWSEPPAVLTDACGEEHGSSGATVVAAVRVACTSAR